MSQKPLVTEVPLAQGKNASAFSGPIRNNSKYIFMGAPRKSGGKHQDLFEGQTVGSLMYILLLNTCLLSIDYCA